MSTPKREQSETVFNVNGWVYSDKEQMNFAMACSVKGFGLPEFDDFLDGLPDGAGKQELLNWRNEAFKLCKTNEQKAFYWCLQAIWVNWASRVIINGAGPTIQMGMSYSNAQSEKGKVRTKQMWGDRDGINKALKLLAGKRDELGDPIPPSELWGDFYSLLDEEQLNPCDTSGERIKDSDRMKWKGNDDGMTFKTFRTRISGCRNPKK